MIHCIHNYVKSHSVDVVDSYNDLYAFHYSPHEKKFSRENGWSIFHHKKEFGRMGIPNDYWHYSPLNENYKVSAIGVRGWRVSVTCRLL